MFENWKNVLNVDGDPTLDEKADIDFTSVDPIQ